MWAYAHDAGRLAIATALLVAGAAKLASPRPFAFAVAEVFGWTRRSGVVLARTVAAVELTSAFLIATGAMAGAAPILAGLVGTGIVVFALAAMRRGSTAPCGCFGESGGRPLGVRNLLAGLGLLAGAVILPTYPATAPAGLMLPLTAVSALLAVMVRDRARLLAPFRHHFQPAPAAPVPAHRRSTRG